jgi:pimeloyl-ACP methyl ester carboxylesterase
MSASPREQVPAWFRSALDVPAVTDSVLLDGAEIRFRCWGPAGAPGLVLVHGSAAHARWWDHVGPMLAGNHRVAAVDLSGHGESDHRDRYSMEQWSAELAAVAAVMGADATPPVLVGHSMGGLVCLTAARDRGHELSGVITVDSAPRLRDPEREAFARARAGRSYRRYPSLDEAIARFTPKPAQTGSLSYVLAHVAAHSYRLDAAGEWRPKFDPAIYDRAVPLLDEVAGFGCPVTVLRAENGTLRPELISAMRVRLPAVDIITIPAAHHHAMLDQPLALTAAVRTQLAAWQSRPAQPAGG